MVQIHSVAFVHKSDLLEGLSESIQIRTQVESLNRFTWGDTAHTMITLDEFREAVGCDSAICPEFETLGLRDSCAMRNLWQRLDSLREACGGLLMVDLAR